MFFLKLISRLPFSVLYAISDLAYFVAYHLAKYRIKVVRNNLANSFPQKTTRELREIEKQFYKNLCDYGVEMLKLLTISKDELTRRMLFLNPEVPASFKNKNQSILFLASHQFNWEWLLVSASISFPMEIEFVYQPVKNKFFDRLSLFTRSRFGALGIKRKDVAREIVKRKHKLRGIASVADQYPGYDADKKFESMFLNQETVFFYGTNQLAHLTQYPVMYYVIRKVKRGYYTASPLVLSTPPYAKESNAVIEQYIQALEKTINNDPSTYLWSHKRWKKRHLKTS